LQARLMRQASGSRLARRKTNRVFFWIRAFVFAGQADEASLRSPVPWDRSNLEVKATVKQQ
jgi:hypothetical protein